MASSDLVLRQETSSSLPDGFRVRGHLLRRRNKYRLGLAEADHRFRVTCIDRSGSPSCVIASPYWYSQRLKIDRDPSALRLHQPSGLYPSKHGGSPATGRQSCARWSDRCGPGRNQDRRFARCCGSPRTRTNVTSQRGPYRPQEGSMIATPPSTSHQSGSGSAIALHDPQGRLWSSSGMLSRKPVTAWAIKSSRWG